MDNSINIPVDLIVRSLPVNDELLELLRERRSEQADVLEYVRQFVHLDELDDREAGHYMAELSRICSEDFHDNSSDHIHLASEDIGGDTPETA